MVRVRNGHSAPFYFGYNDPLPMLVEGVAAFFLVGILASEHGRIRLLRSGCAISLGNVSYSLYLIHFPIAVMVAKILSKIFSDGTNPITATVVLMLFSLTMSLGLATLIYRFIEIPSIAFGKNVSKRLGSYRAPIKV